jgi:hypothetical protein
MRIAPSSFLQAICGQAIWLRFGYKISRRRHQEKRAASNVELTDLFVAHGPPENIRSDNVLRQEVERQQISLR